MPQQTWATAQMKRLGQASMAAFRAAISNKVSALDVDATLKAQRRWNIITTPVDAADQPPVKTESRYDGFDRLGNNRCHPRGRASCKG